MVENIITSQEFLNIIQSFSIGGGIVVFALVLRPLINAWAERMKNNRKMNSSDGSRLSELERFKLKVEQNHLHDIDEMKDDIKRLWSEVSNIRERLVRIETKLNGKL